MATALLLAGAGYRVFAGVRDNDAELVAQAQERGLQVTTVQMNIRDTASVRSTVAQVISEAGKIDVLVNNAGFGLLATIEDGTDEEMIQQFDMNLPHQCCSSDGGFGLRRPQPQRPPTVPAG
jgi:NAD(P)-dependent dehydrogenase (short-subunit alcohol dehydrogenase family)